jgi:hypothetical protein
VALGASTRWTGWAAQAINPQAPTTTPAHDKHRFIEALLKISSSHALFNGSDRVGFSASPRDFHGQDPHNIHKGE